ncbi:uncharacterized protein LOC109410276 [Aedes albopictus]|uniref:ER-bound oxygenase mpaB/mpaB'/Rubber oxygenase catalytic domain-containing protein n=1 Tax=Aedes albopictus TaxID=7160 RepID=A0ABM1YDP0_AEDAL
MLIKFNLFFFYYIIILFLAAKTLFAKIIVEGSSIPCDIGSGIDLEQKLPQWYDEAKFKRGQKYFFDNRFGMMQANYCGLVSLLCDPKGLTILHNTGRSSTAETARKRYISTTLHMLSWYEIDLSPGSKSWDSLMRVRKMHLNASKRSQEKEIGFITQTEVSLTVFGFLGYALIRPHLLGIRYDNDDDREGFVHFWAVVAAMLGVHDRFNICLPKLAVVEMICKICQRYIFMPLLQIETTLFRSMVQAIVDGLSEFTPFNSYESLMYFVRRVAGIPGYQHNVDLKKETICRKLFSKEEMTNMRKVFEGKPGYEYMEQSVIDDRILLFNIKQVNGAIELNQDSLDNNLVSGVYNKLNDQPISKNFLIELLGLKHNEELVIEAVENEEDWISNLNDSKLELLSDKDLRYFKFKCRLMEKNYTRIGNFLNESMLSWMLYRMRKAHSSQ